MRIVIDSKTLWVITVGVIIGMFYHFAEPMTKILMQDIGYGIVIVSFVAMAIGGVLTITELMIWDYLWDKTRGSDE